MALHHYRCEGTLFLLDVDRKPDGFYAEVLSVVEVPLEGGEPFVRADGQLAIVGPKPTEEEALDDGAAWVDAHPEFWSRA